jgi:hypothetical protein
VLLLLLRYGQQLIKRFKNGVFLVSRKCPRRYDRADLIDDEDDGGGKFKMKLELFLKNHQYTLLREGD